MQSIAIRLRIIFLLFYSLLSTACEHYGAYIYNDTERRLYIEIPATAKCNPSNDYLESGDVVYNHCRISETISMKLTDVNGKVCIVDMGDFRRKIVIKQMETIWGGEEENLYLSKLNCPNLGLPK